MKPVALLSLLCLLIARLAGAAEFQPVESIRATALSALGADASAETTLDPALRLPRCAGALQSRIATAGSVEVWCPDAAGWRLFVPVRIRRSQDVVMLTRGLAAGESVTIDSVISEQRDASRIAGIALADPQAAIGRIARRSLPAGSVLGPGDLVAPRLVRRGDTVTLVARSGGVEVRVAGRALADAGESERVAVENLSSRRIIQGVVGPGGEIRVSR